MAGWQLVEWGSLEAYVRYGGGEGSEGGFGRGHFGGFAAVRKGHFAGFETSERVTWAVSSERNGSLGGFSAGESVRFGGGV